MKLVNYRSNFSPSSCARFKKTGIRASREFAGDNRVDVRIVAATNQELWR